MDGAGEDLTLASFVGTQSPKMENATALLCPYPRA